MASEQVVVEEPPRTATAEFEAADRRLRPTMSFTQILFMSIGAIIGSGWLFAELGASALAGPAAIVSWVIGATLIFFVALSYAEIAGMLPRTGAIVRYPHLTHGAYTGWIMGWTYWLSAISVPAIEAIAVVTYVGGRYPGAGFLKASGGTTLLQWPWGILFAVGLMLLFFCLNVLGVRVLGEANRWVVWWKLAVPIATFCFLFTIFDSANFTAYGGFFPNGSSPIFGALASGIIFAFLGFRQSLDYAGESRNPQRDVPLATLLCLLITMVIYVLVQTSFTGAIDWHAAGVAAGHWGGLASSPWASGPLYKAVTAAGISSLTAFGTVLLIDAGVSPAGTGWIYLGTSIRTNYGLSIGGFAPRLLQRMNRFGIPWFSALVAFVIGCLFFIPSPSWYRLVGFITSATVLTYMMGGAGLPVMRRHAADLHRPFRLPAAAFWAPVGFLSALMIVYWSGFVTLNNVFAAIFVGLPLYSWHYAVGRGWVRPLAGTLLGAVFLAAWIYINVRGGWTLAQTTQRGGSWPFWLYDVAFSADVIFFCAGLWAVSGAEGREHVRRTAWLIWLILATFPLSYWGDYGPHKHNPLAFPWGTLIEVGVGIVTYYWAVASGFATDELREIVRAAREAPGARG